MELCEETQRTPCPLDDCPLCPMRSPPPPVTAGRALQVPFETINLLLSSTWFVKQGESDAGVVGTISACSVAVAYSTVPGVGSALR